MSWVAMVAPFDGQEAYVKGKLRALVSLNRERDGRRWMHLSISRSDRLPSWEELRDAKNELLGRHVKAIQVLPPEDEYVNIHPNVLHLWVCLDGDVLPDFRHGGMI